jgi:tetratricopeptide (TPR) repeat protein
MRRIAVVLLAGLLLTACDRQDQRNEAIELGDKRAKVGAFDEAVRAYESALDGTPKTAEVHYKIGVLYDAKLNNPLGAIHHYSRYLELATAGARTKEATTAKADCEKRLNATMRTGGFITTAEAVRLRNENEKLKRDLAEALSPKPPATPRVANPSAADPVPAGARKHVVAKGETLASLAFKYYRNRAQSGRIKDANFNQLGGKDIIRPGQTLIIPEMPAKKRP